MRAFVPDRLRAAAPPRVSAPSLEPTQPVMATLGLVGNSTALAALVEGAPLDGLGALVADTTALGLAGVTPQAAPGAGSNQATLAVMRLAAAEGVDPGALAGLRLGGGRPLPPAVLTRLSQVFGRDFGHVRLHQDAAAARLAEAAQARAFTVGHEIWFNAGELDLTSPEGIDLLLHELTHVVQADDGRLPTGPGLRVSSPHDPHEQEAEREAARLAPLWEASTVADETGLMGEGLMDEDAWAVAVDARPVVTASGDAAGLASRQDKPPARGASAGVALGPPAEVVVTGLPDYYQSRNDDVLRRAAEAGVSISPPDYYLNYGGKYCKRFTTELRPKLSANGQAWLDQTALNLQNAIEQERARDGEAFGRLEQNNEAFRAFAYGTHADAYLDAGLGDLDPIDLVMIGLTPDVGDLLTVPGISQAVESALRILPEWGDNLDTFTPEQAAVIDQWIRSQRDLISIATEIGYELTAEALEGPIQEFEEIFGPGSAEDTLDALRIEAQEGLEFIAAPIQEALESADVEWPWEDG